jgi:hypothetical protein
MGLILIKEFNNNQQTVMRKKSKLMKKWKNQLNNQKLSQIMKQKLEECKRKKINFKRKNRETEPNSKIKKNSYFNNNNFLLTFWVNLKIRYIINKKKTDNSFL